MVVSFETPAEAVRLRLDQRFAQPPPWDRSDATWDIYVRMAAEAEPVRGPHFVVDMSRDVTEAVEEVAAAVRGTRR